MRHAEGQPVRDALRDVIFWRHPLLSGLAIVIAFIVMAGDWDWLRPLVERAASTAIGREVTIAHFEVENLLSPAPLFVADGITIGNPADFPDESRFGSIDRLSVRLDALAALNSYGDDIVLPQITVEHPQGDLRLGRTGDPNWVFSMPASSGKPPRIGSLIVTDGTLHIVDPKVNSDFTVAINTAPPGKDGEARIVARARGTYSGAPINAEFIGGSLLSLRDPAKPYPVDFKAASGSTRIAVKGTVREPLHLKGANLHLDLVGKDLADLYQVLGIPLAPTPPYHLSGQLDYADQKIRFRNFTGTVGNSDLEGDFEVEPGRERPVITADLTSRRVVLADLAGFIGAAPGKSDNPNQSEQQKIAHARQEASPKLLPDMPINLPKIRAADFKVHYKGRRIDSKATPLDNLEAYLTIDDGKVALHPLSFGVGTGEISSDIALDAQRNRVHAKARIDFRRVDLHRIMESTKIFAGAGVIGGRAEIDGSGNSLAELLGHGNGNLKLFMNGGDVSALLVDLAGLDFGGSLKSVLGLPSKTTIRCMVSDFELKQGVLQTQALVFDTKEANIIGTGSVDLGQETVQYRLTQEPKHFSIGAFHAPIDIDGRLKRPSIKPDPTILGARTGAAVLLGVLLTPAAALLPTVQLGLANDNDCDQLTRSAVASTMAAHALARAPN